MSMLGETLLVALGAAASVLVSSWWKGVDDPMRLLKGSGRLGAAPPRIETANWELDRTPGPEELYPTRFWEKPDSLESRARERARALDSQSRLDRFGDALEVQRRAQRVLSEFQAAQAQDAARLSSVENSCGAELALYSNVNRVHHQMTLEFLRRLSQIEGLREQLPPELMDALKERAFEEYTDRVNRASKHSILLSQGQKS